METLTEQLHDRDVHVEDQNGIVTVDDLDHIQKVNRELEQQLGDKNRVSCCSVPILCSFGHSSLLLRHVILLLQTIKQLQQRLAELKRTLQKELVRHSETQQPFFVLFSRHDNISADCSLIRQPSDLDQRCSVQYSSELTLGDTQFLFFVFFF